MRQRYHLDKYWFLQLLLRPWFYNIDCLEDLNEARSILWEKGIVVSPTISIVIQYSRSKHLLGMEWAIPPPDSAPLQDLHLRLTSPQTSTTIVLRRNCRRLFPDSRHCSSCTTEMEAASTGSKKASAISRCIKALSPVKVLCRARDFYVRSMLGCAGRVAYADMGYSGVPNLPRSFSTTLSRYGHDEEDMRELMRIASLRASRHKVDDHGYPQSAGYRAQPAGARRVPRSHSVHITRIDEDKPCSFSEKGGEDGIFPRSRSYAPQRRNRFGL